MSIFIPNRSIKLPKDISVPQSLSPSIFETHRRDQAFQLSKRFDGALVDVVSGAKAASVISGVRYGIVNGVVTEFGVNQPALEDDGLRGCPAFTQLAQYTEDLTNKAWVNNYCSLESAASYRAMSLWLLRESTALFYHFLSFNNPVQTNNSVFGVCFVAKRNGRSVGIGLTLKTGTVVTAFFNLLTGVVAGGTASYKAIWPLSDGFFLCFMAHNIGEGTQAQTVNTVLTTESMADKYQGDGVSGFYFGQPTYINFGVNGIPFVPPYVPNNTLGSISVVSETATSTTGTSFDLDNIKLARTKTALRGPNAQGHIELTFKSNVNSGWLGAGVRLNLFSCANNTNVGLRVVHVAANNNTIGVYDGSVADVWLQYDRELVVGEIFKISLDWGTHSTGQKMRITINGVKSSLVNFSGSFGSQDLRFFFGNTVHAGWIKKDSLKIYDKPRW